LASKVEAKVKSYDGKVVDQYKGKEELGYFAITMRFATGSDKVLFWAASFSIAIYASTRPLFSLLMGANTKSTSDTAHESDHKAWEQPVRMICLGVIAWIFRFIQVGGL